jgi:DNA-binding response OmpR family regulator
VSRKILIVDDEKSILTMLSKAFTMAGYDPVVAVDAEAALAILDTTTIFVVFTDLKLPGMNGIDLCREIKRENPLTCVFVMTGFSSLFELADCRDAGADDYFIKPISIEIFRSSAAAAFEKLERWNVKLS